MDGNSIRYEGLTDSEALLLRRIHDCIRAVYGRPFMNETTKPDGFKFLLELARLVPATNGRVDYLEIGSFRGASLVVIASILRSMARLGTVCSIDPYFSDGYCETPPFTGKPGLKQSTEKTMHEAYRLYKAADLRVEHVRDVSASALVGLLRAERMFDLVYIDGSHEGLNPMIDLALSLQLIRPGGCIMLDDVSWPDVKPVAGLCNRHLRVLSKGFCKVCYQTKTDEDGHPQEGRAQ